MLFSMAQTQTGLVRVGADGSPQVRRKGGLHRAAKGYIVTDPQQLVDRLLDRGWDARICTGGKGFHSNQRDYNRFWSVVEASPPGELEMPTANTQPGDIYKSKVSFLMDHRGRESFKILPVAWRMGCLNEFICSPVRINHMSPELHEVLANPHEYALAALKSAKTMADLVEKLRGRPCHDDFPGFARKYYPRVGRKVQSYWLNYADRDGDTVWAALQAFTNSRSPSLLKYVTEGVEKFWVDLYNGVVPPQWVTAEEIKLEKKLARKAEKQAARIDAATAAVDRIFG